MSIETVNELSMCNPSTALEFGRIPITSLDEVESAVSKARKAQKVWGNLPWASRRAILQRWWKALSNEADAWADAITEEIGKPRAEAMAGDVVPLSTRCVGPSDTEARPSSPSECGRDINAC